MASLSWIAVVLTFSLSVGNNLAALDQNYLTTIVQQIMNKYGRGDRQYSIAVTVPEDKTKLHEVFDSDKSTAVKEYENGVVYVGTNVVAAKPNFIPGSYTEHAEARVLDKVQELANKEGYILIIYSYYSPCGAKCTDKDHKFNILDKIKDKVKNIWKEYAFVFTTVFDRTSTEEKIPKKQTETALSHLAEAIGHDKISACYTEKNDFICLNCYNNKKEVAPECIDNFYYYD
ncbi:uncharacterized protein si:dkey-96g2.1 [Centropristis striata]|uniref:uncharacterized protein si:dkey-96g2.1 n=1 Tax=Centropristis striata TaxID=184440 RepID=UPI0027E0E9C4|nr:uncharacterized protein si:dkey-96g2.1 [Centropristis striata]